MMEGSSEIEQLAAALRPRIGRILDRHRRRRKRTASTNKVAPLSASRTGFLTPSGTTHDHRLTAWLFPQLADTVAKVGRMD
jgi:hypothetical protein